MKRCKICKKEKRIEEDFPKFSVKEGKGTKNTCKECSSKLNKTRGKLRKEKEVINLLNELKGCPICRREKGELMKKLVLDHNHESGRFRGWICQDCNLGLGKFDENIDSLKRAIDYLSLM